jgi:oxygen-dependent protoporphyrinogen oxidase
VKRIAIIGGGISGLAAAHRLTCLRPEWHVTLFEARNRLGGVLETIHRDGFLIERSADNFIATADSPWAMRFCEQIGFRDQLIPTSDENRRAMVLFRGRLHPVPSGFQLLKPANMWAIASSSLLSPLGKVRLAMERFVARGTGDDESLTEFAIRRLGREAFERLVQPLVAGIYTADPDRLSMKAALPEFLNMERESGSLIAAARHLHDTSSGARYGLFWAPKSGMGSLIDAVVSKLHDVTYRLNHPVDAVRQVERHWQLQSQGESDLYDGLIVALPATRAAAVLRTTNEDLASELASITHASSTVVCLGYCNQQFRTLPNCFGCVIPRIENRKLLAISFSSMKYPLRAPAGHQLLRVFLGGALQPELAKLSDDETSRIVQSELGAILGIKGDPCLVQIVRWPDTMPQYVMGHTTRVARIDDLARQFQGLELACNGLKGVGVPQCIRSGTEAAERLASAF